MEPQTHWFLNSCPQALVKEGLPNENEYRHLSATQEKETSFHQKRHHGKYKYDLQKHQGI
jgi:hypothetical protein